MEQSINEVSFKINEKIKPESKIVIMAHVNPDGDAIGSALGLYHHLKSTVAEVNIIMPNQLPEFLKFLPGSDKIITFDKKTKKASEIILNADILFFLDFNDLKRIEKMGELCATAKGIKIMIDHHPNPVSFADFTVSETSACSTSELIFEFVSNIENKNFKNKDLANCLLVGIITDTGLFNHNSERRRTFEIVAELLDMGADKANIIHKIYNEYSYNRMQLLGNALHNRLVVFQEFGAAYIYLPKEDLLKYDYQIGDIEGFVNIPLSISGIKFSAIFLEKDDQIKCSFRSLGSFDVNAFARKYFGGGGHVNASGGRSYESLNKTLEIFVQLLKEYQNDIKQSI